MIRIIENGNNVKLLLPKEFNFNSHGEFRDLYCHRPRGTFYEIDFKNVVKFDSAAMGILLLLRSYCGDDRTKISLVNCSDEILKQLQGASFGRYFIMQCNH